MSLFGPSLLSMLSGAVDYNQPSVLNCTGMATGDLGPFLKKSHLCPGDTRGHVEPRHMGTIHTYIHPRILHKV